MPKPPLLPGQKRRSYMSRGEKGLARSGNYNSALQRSGRLRKVGKTGRKNRRALAAFKRECARLGVDGRCEVRRPGCFGEATTWAHGRRRRNLKAGELERFAVAACVPCHRWLDEELSREECASEVERIIGLRPERYLEAA